MEYSSKGITLSMADTKAGTFKQLYGLHKIPDMGADREKIDVTNFDDGHKRYIAGVGDFGDLTFDFFYNKETSDDDDEAVELLNVYKALKTAETADEPKWFKLEYPDGTGHIWQGDISVKRTGAGVNEALKFQLTTTVRSEIEEV